MDVRLVPNQSENCKYNQISVWINKIPKSFLCVCTQPTRAKHRSAGVYLLTLPRVGIWKLFSRNRHVPNYGAENFLVLCRANLYLLFILLLLYYYIYIYIYIIAYTIVYIYVKRIYLPYSLYLGEVKELHLPRVIVILLWYWFWVFTLT